MRTKLAIAATAALAAGVTVATPAAAQDYRYGGYNNAPYGQAYGYNRGADPRMLMGQLEQIKRDIHHFAAQRMITGHERNKLMRRAEQIQAAVAERGVWITALIRLSPAVPFNLTSFVLGASRIRFAPFLVASLLGMLPIKLLLVFTAVYAWPVLRGALLDALDIPEADREGIDERLADLLARVITGDR